MTLGEFLQRARESVGLSIDELAELTSIRSGLLKEIEKNNFVHCGGDTYARGHLRNIAPKISVDPQELIDLYNEEHSSEYRKIHDMLVENNATKFAVEGRKISWKSLAVISILVLVAAAVVQIVVSNSSTTILPRVTSSPSTSPANSAAPSPTESSPSAEPSATGENLELTISAARGNSSIHVVTAGKNLYKGALFQGEIKTFTGKNSISIYLSNAGDLDLTLNGEKLAPLGARNQEVRETFNRK